MIKLLIVDDSALMRRKLSTLFEQAGGFEIRLARNGREAVEENRAFLPDVVTLDINMPEMDGLTALSLVMAERPTPVVMLSSLTVKSALATFEAFALGAVDCVAKPDGTISLHLERIEEELLSKVKQAARARPRTARATPAPKPKAAMPVPKPAAAPRREGGLVLIGVSTGGPRTLEDILPLLPADFPWPVLIAQHMPAAFTGLFAQRLDRICALQVHEVAEPMPLVPGNVYIARGGGDVVVSKRRDQRVALPQPAHPQHLWHPSVELLGRSALQHYPARELVAVMLTGMGHDGAEAFAEIHRGGGLTVAESEESAVVFGMPERLIQQGGADRVLPANRIAKQLVEWLH
ncbi:MULTISPECIES: chemotaxis-specific protein-glutamate methyltransferase CheB [Xanthomonas]|uniref:Protein-glutamate methylesterase/protein-glutamine glutaminase n=1 Tax=Xanthomonas rydalmerensis TaxID=3046274 RepID=A0ABZ0JPC0_9XANT|nr:MULTISPECIES: chemotaxis-specific protein-glutamate methyltransferase CheB [unclassified Xanthomonas]MBB5944177.1 two-component system chemotaxis response regulator CheB [Xanthomonas sp. 3307]WOS41667.1 chemotaxis-specific protein-glutamate methyltransferase CheB [Xanthomonas sp. DM-2023]WOS45853.1 chemotaxis-specific protein-glutamate methyltransferase CheB [Xanthomonas sp. DM-2023]WOS50032.1 chemotaxis-specific protein-glutamate methyltransferase CheB [Xanthomonas sp. DM-2023]WOS54211.1 c